MPSCEKCWKDSASFAGDHSADYAALVMRRTESGQVCTPEEQAGEDAGTCPSCDRKTIHQHARVCMNPACQPRKENV